MAMAGQPFVLLDQKTQDDGRTVKPEAAERCEAGLTEKTESCIRQNAGFNAQNMCPLN